MSMPSSSSNLLDGDVDTDEVKLNVLQRHAVAGHLLRERPEFDHLARNLGHDGVVHVLGAVDAGHDLRLADVELEALDVRLELLNRRLGPVHDVSPDLLLHLRQYDQTKNTEGKRKREEDVG